MITLLTSCAVDPRPLGPREGLYWRTWIPLGLAQLWSSPADGSAQGAFSRRFMERVADDIQATFEAGLRTDCDVVLGVSATRVTPRLVQTPAEGLDLPRIEEKFAVRIRGRGPGRAPRITNHVSATTRWPQLLLPEGPDGEVAFSSLRELIFASAAFPIAFPPQPLRHCVAAASGGKAPTCPAASAKTELFVDGGLLDNSPLRLAVRLASAGLRPDGQGGARWLDLPQGDRLEPPERIFFTYVTPDAAAYPAEEDRLRFDQSTPVLALTQQLFEAFVSTARAKNLTTLLEEYPAVADRFVVPLRNYPAASAPMNAFLGFFETGFREFDFYLGMYDARRTVLTRILPSLQRTDPAFRLSFPDEPGATPDWRPFHCLRAVVRELPGSEQACQGPELADFRVLLQASIFQLWDRCTIGDGEALRNSVHPHCLDAQAGKPPLLVPGLADAAAVEWRHRPEELEATYVVRLLSALGFKWRDLGLEPGEGEEAPVRIREKLGAITDSLSARQPTKDRLLLSTLGATAANSIAYVSPRWLAWLTLGRQLEVGASYDLPTRRLDALRLHAAIQVEGIFSALSSDRSKVAPVFLLGAEVRPSQFASATWQPSAVLRAGAVVTSNDQFGGGNCPAHTRDTAACTRPVLQVGLAVSLLESVRLQLTADWFPRWRSDQDALWAVSPSLGIQVPF
jgi:hypothetical protein